jgi:ABC-type multidrug transport system fused ATPase/permease subunit
MRQLTRIRQSLRIRPSLRQLLRAARVKRLVPIFVVASAIGAVLEVAVLAVVAQAAVSLSAGSGHVDLTGPLAVLRGVSPGTLILVGFCLCVARLGPFYVVAEVPGRVSADVQEQLRGRLFRAYLRAPWREQMRVREGHLQEMAGVQTWRVAEAAIVALQSLAQAVALGILVIGALILSPAAATAVLFSVAVLFFALRPLAGAVKRSAQLHAEAGLDFTQELNEAASLVADARTYGVIDAEEARVGRALAKVGGPWHRVQRAHGLIPGAYQTAAATFLLAGLAVVSATGTTSFASLGAVVLILLRALASSQQLQYAYQRMGETQPYVDRVLSSIEELEATREVPGTRHLDRVERVDLERVSFAYSPDRPALDGVGFGVESGESVAVMGQSGAGKSTLAAILLGLLSPEGGRYLVNDVPAAEIARSDWARLVGYVPQEGRLLTGTIADNIRFLRDDITDDEVIRAARAAHLHDEVLRWPDGYDTMVSQRAEAVSGGQRQRICLARALVRRPDLLVLDEPTSALDTEAEDVVYASLADLKGTVTMIVISHRPRVFELCDRVIVLRQGQVIEDGPVQPSAVNIAGS